MQPALRLRLEASSDHVSTHIYYVRIAQEDRNRAWASPIWVRYEAK